MMHTVLLILIHTGLLIIIHKGLLIMIHKGLLIMIYKGLVIMIYKGLLIMIHKSANHDPYGSDVHESYKSLRCAINRGCPGSPGIAGHDVHAHVSHPCVAEDTVHACARLLLRSRGKERWRPSGSLSLSQRSRANQRTFWSRQSANTTCWSHQGKARGCCTEQLMPRGGA